MASILSNQEACRDKLDKERAVKNGALKLANTANREEQYLEALKAIHVADMRTSALAADLQKSKMLQKQNLNNLMNLSPSKSNATPTPNNDNYMARLLLEHIKIPLTWSKSLIDEAVKKHHKKQPFTRLCVFATAKLSTTTHQTKIQDTELLCIPASSQFLEFQTPISFDHVPNDFVLELNLSCLPMTDVPASAENNKKLLKLLVKRHKEIDEILRQAEKNMIYDKENFSQRSSFRRKNILKHKSDNNESCLEKQEWINYATASLDLYSAVESKKGGQRGKFRLSRAGNMLHRYLPISNDFSCRVILRPDCFDNVACESYVNYFDEQTTVGPPVWKYMYWACVFGRF